MKRGEIVALALLCGTVVAVAAIDAKTRRVAVSKLASRWRAPQHWSSRRRRRRRRPPVP